MEIPDRKSKILSSYAHSVRRESGNFRAGKRSLIFLLTTIAQVDPSYGKKLHKHLLQTQP